jgi:signal transduction histidine kinase
MTSIRSFAEVLLSDDTLSARQRERFVRIIFEESQRLTRLLNEILDLSRLEKGEEVLEMRPLDPAGVLREAVAAMSGFGHQRGVVVEQHPSAARLLVRADPDRLKQVFINLIHNAIKFNTSPHPRVDVAVAERDGLAVITVADNGPGIAPADRPLVFEKFSRPGAPGEGSGLGLAICRQILEAHGGSIQLAAAPEGGAVFEVRLPLHAPAVTPVGLHDAAAAR